jgi:hypothetical protein
VRASKLVICIEISVYPASLERRKIYEPLPDFEAEKIGQVRIIDESGEDYLYPYSFFVDAKLPEAVQAAVIEAA